MRINRTALAFALTLCLALGLTACTEGECTGLEMMDGDACLLSDTDDLCPAATPDRFEGPDGVLCTAEGRDRDDFSDRECAALGLESGCGFVVLGECPERRRSCFACGTNISPDATCAEGAWSCPAGFSVDPPSCAECDPGANNSASAPICSSCEAGTEVLATCNGGSWSCPAGSWRHSECSDFAAEGGLCAHSEACAPGQFCQRAPGCVAMGRCTSLARMTPAFCASWQADNAPLPSGPRNLFVGAPEGAYCSCEATNATLNEAGCAEIPMRRLGVCAAGVERSGEDPPLRHEPGFFECHDGDCEPRHR